MKSYVEAKHFKLDELALLHRATRLVDNVSDSWGPELRCHELVRAVATVMRKFGLANHEIVDGKLAAVEHSWLVITRYVACIREYPERYILDVYCPGRIPQVQLIHPFSLLRAGYEPGEARTDIRWEIVERLINEMECR